MKTIKESELIEKLKETKKDSYEIGVGWAALFALLVLPLLTVAGISIILILIIYTLFIPLDRTGKFIHEKLFNRRS